MNPNHLPSQQNLLRLTNNLSIPKLGAQSPFISQSLPQTPQKPSHPHFDNLIRFKPDRPFPSSDFTLDPTKKVKYNPLEKPEGLFQGEQGYQSISPLSLTPPIQRNHIKHFSFHSDKPGLERHAEDPPNPSYTRHFSFDQQSLSNNPLYNFWANQNPGNLNLDIPALNALYQNNLNEGNLFMSPEVLDLFKNQQFEQQLKEQHLHQQKMEQKMHYQYIKYLQQQQFDEFMQQHFGKKAQYKREFDQQGGPQKLRDLEATVSAPLTLPPNISYNVSNKQFNLKQKASLVPNSNSNVNIRHIKEGNFHVTFDSALHENTLKSLNVSKVAEFPALMHEKNYKIDGSLDKWQYNGLRNLEDQLENISQSIEPDILEIKGKEADGRRPIQKRLMKKRRQGQNQNLSNAVAPHKMEPRRKNKWQKMVEEKQQDSGVPNTFEQTSGLTTGSGMNEETDLTLNSDKPQEPIQEGMEPVQGKRNKFNRYLVESDENVDYNYLISVTITKDPAYTGSNDLSEGFVVVTNRSGLNDGGEEGEIKPREIHVNKSSQANIPDIDLGATRTVNRRKYPSLVWNPKAVREDDLQKYFEELGKILKCGTINQERALKLLKRKNYKKEKVKTNVSKNEKFYSNFLVVLDNINCTLKTDN